MADEFDPLKQPAPASPEDLYATVQKNTPNSDDDLLRPQFETILKAGQKPTYTYSTQQSNPSAAQQANTYVTQQSNPSAAQQTNTYVKQQSNTYPAQQTDNYTIPQISKPPEQRPQESVYEKLNFTSSAPKAPVRSTNPFAEDIQKPSSSTPPSTPSTPANANQPFSLGTSTTTNEKRKEQEWENPANYHQDYEPAPEPEPSPYYYSEEYYDYQSGYRKKGVAAVAAAIDRFVQRFPALGIFYKQPTSEVYESEHGHEYVDQQVDDVPPLVLGNPAPRELTADELALNGRYSNKLRTQIISLQPKDYTQPVDVSIHHDSYTIYCCDVGRSVIEIFDMYGKLQHVIDDHTTLKFQPTAIAVAYDGTIIVTSHFNHRLHMYSPQESQQNDAYHYEQYKLGSPGHDLHQFHHPADIAIDYHDGYIYVCDRGNHRIQVLRPEGICERIIQLLSYEKPESSVSPLQIAHQRNADQLVCIINSGDAICFIPKHSNGPIYIEPLYIVDNDGLGLLGASGITTDSDDRIYISDTGHHRIVICTPEGYYISHFGSEGNGACEVKRPCGIDMTSDGTIVVADSGNKRLQLFGSIREKAHEEVKPKEKVDDKNLLGDADKAGF